MFAYFCMCKKKDVQDNCDYLGRERSRSRGIISISIYISLQHFTCYYNKQESLSKYEKYQTKEILKEKVRIQYIFVNQVHLEIQIDFITNVFSLGLGAFPSSGIMKALMFDQPQ